MIQLGSKKYLDIVSSSIIYKYDINKTQNIILNMPWFYTPASHFSRQGNDTMGKIAEQKLAMTSLLYIFGGICFSRPLPGILTKHNIRDTVSEGSIWGQFYIPKVEGLNSC